MGAHLFTNNRAAAWICCVVAAVVFSLSAQQARGQASYTSRLPALDVTVAINKTQIVVGEPVTLSVTLENVSPSPLVEVSASFQFPEGNGVELKVQPPGELLYRYTGAYEIGSYPSQPIRVVRGVPKTVELLLLYDRTQPSGYLFSQAGTYQVSGGVSLNINNNQMAEVAAIPDTQIEVSPREGVETEVFQLLDEPELARALHLGITITTGNLERLEPIAEKYPKTELGALALRSVGQQLALADSPERERGAAMLQQYLANGIVPVDGDYSAWAIAAAYNMTGKYDLAREWIYYAMRHYPRSTRVRPEDALYKYYFFDPAEFASQVPWYLLKEPWKVPGTTPPTSLKPVMEEK